MMRPDAYLGDVLDVPTLGIVPLYHIPSHHRRSRSLVVQDAAEESHFSPA